MCSNSGELVHAAVWRLLSSQCVQEYLAFILTGAYAGFCCGRGAKIFWIPTLLFNVHLCLGRLCHGLLCLGRLCPGCFALGLYAPYICPGRLYSIRLYTLLWPGRLCPIRLHTLLWQGRLFSRLLCPQHLSPGRFCTEVCASGVYAWILKRGYRYNYCGYEHLKACSILVSVKTLWRQIQCWLIIVVQH